MNETKKTVLVIVFVVSLVLFLSFGGVAMTGTTMSGGMMGNGNVGGISWMWLPTLLSLGNSILVGWALLQKQ